MALVCNKKTANVGLPLKKGSQIVQFKPGTHEYPDHLIDNLDTSRKSVRSYFEGDDPVLVVNPGEIVRPDPVDEPEPMSVKDAVAMIKESADLGLLRKLAENDQRKTVIKAANKRLDDLEAGE